MSAFKARKVQKKKKSGLYKLLVLAAVVLTAVFLFHIREIKVTGIENLTKQEVVSWVKSDRLSGNSLYVLAKSRIYPDQMLPMMKSVRLGLKNPWTLEVAVREKRILGGIFQESEYLYFDEEAVVLKKQSGQLPGIPLIEGVEVGKSRLHGKLKAANRKLFSYVLQVGGLIDKWDIEPDRIVFEGTDISLYFGELCFRIGDTEFNDRIAQVGPIFEKLQGQRGTVYLEKFTSQSTSVKFVPAAEGQADDGEGAEESVPVENTDESEEDIQENWDVEESYDGTQESGYEDSYDASYDSEDDEEDTDSYAGDEY